MLASRGSISGSGSNSNSVEMEKMSQLFKNVRIGPKSSGSDSRRGSSSGELPKSFYMGTNPTYISGPGHGGITIHGVRDRESPSRTSCQLHVSSTGVEERRGSFGRKAGTPPHNFLSSTPPGNDHSNSRRGSSPCDLHFFPNRKDSRKFSSDSIDEPPPISPGGKQWAQEDVIIEENENEIKPKFVAVNTLEDSQAIRCAEFHPKGHLYALGSNSKSLRICAYPDVHHIREDSSPKESKVIYKRNKHHRGSIYCLGWSPDGQLLATGSNDKTVKISRFEDTSRTDLNHSQEIELTMHDGTVRDVCFIEDLSNKSSLLVSGGAGDCKVYVTDCVTATPFQALSGHSAPILTLYTWGGAMFCSGSQDKSVRIWDLRTRGCVNVITPITSTTTSTAKSAVGSVCVDPSGRLLVTGHEDSAIVLYDIRGNRQVQNFKPHSAGADVRSVRLSPNSYYLLSGGYDQRLMLTDLQGDLSQNLASVVVGTHSDKVISGRWHPTELSFISTSADKTCTLWSLPSAP